MTTQQLMQMARRIPRGIERKEAPSLEQMIGEMKTSIIEKIGVENKPIKERLEAAEGKSGEIQRQLDGLDRKIADRHLGEEGGPKSLVDLLKENESLQRLIYDQKGSAVISFKGPDAAFLERKSTITAEGSGFATPGVMGSDRTAAIVAEARQGLTIRDMLSSRPTSAGLVEFLKVNTSTLGASPQGETGLKHESGVTFVAASERVRTIATTIPGSKQVLQDLPELAGFLESTLKFYVNDKEEAELLAGTNIGEHLHGLIGQAADFDTGLLSGSWDRIDILGLACNQIQSAKELKPTFVVLNPLDWWKIRLTKDGVGRYILGDPQTALQANALFDLRPVITTNISEGTFLVGSGSPAAAEIRDRMETTIEVSTQHSDFFARNMVMFLAEKRVALVVYRPNSYISGTFSTSPA